MKKILFILFSLVVQNAIAQYPQYTATVYNSSSTGYYFVCPLKQGAGNRIYQMILDGNGYTVFYRALPAGYGSLDFKLQPNGMISFFMGSKYYLMDSTFTIVDSVQCKNGCSTNNHDLQIIHGGHFLLMGIEDTVMDLSSYHFFNHNGSVGSTTATVECDVIQEQDANKNVVFEWHAKDYFAFDDVDTFFLGNPTFVDWTHSNSVELDNDGNILLCGRHFNEVTKISRSDSSIIWRIGGNRNQFTFLNDTVPFLAQHDSRRIANGHMTLYDNGYNAFHRRVRALEYELDEVNKTADLKWSYIYDSSSISLTMGNFQRLANGNSLVNYGTIANQNYPCFTVVDSLDSKVFELAFTDSAPSYRAFNYPNLPWQLHRPEVSCFDSLGVTYLDAGAGHSIYRWNNGATTQIIPVTPLDTYYVFVPYGQDGFISSEPVIVSGVAEWCPTFLSVNENIFFVNGALQIFPNPLSYSFTVSVNCENGLLTLHDIFGREVFRKNVVGEKQISVDSSSLASGIYFVQLNADGKFYRAKVVKQ